MLQKVNFGATVWLLIHFYLFLIKLTTIGCPKGCVAKIATKYHYWIGWLIFFAVGKFDYVVMVRYQNLTRKPELFRALWAQAPPRPGYDVPSELPSRTPCNGIGIVFFPKKLRKNRPQTPLASGGWRLCPQIPVCDTFELQYTPLLKHVSQFRYFCSLTLGLSPVPWTSS